MVKNKGINMNTICSKLNRTFPKQLSEYMKQLNRQGLAKWTNTKGRKLKLPIGTLVPLPYSSVVRAMAARDPGNLGGSCQRLTTEMTDHIEEVHIMFQNLE